MPVTTDTAPVTSEAFVSDLIVKLMHLFQYVGTARIRAGRDKALFLDAQSRRTLLGRFRAMPRDLWAAVMSRDPLAAQFHGAQAQALAAILDQCEACLAVGPFANLPSHVPSQVGHISISGMRDAGGVGPREYPFIRTEEWRQWAAGLSAAAGLVQAVTSEGFSGPLATRAEGLFVGALSSVSMADLSQKHPLFDLIVMSVAMTAMPVVPTLPPQARARLAGSPFMGVWTAMLFETGGPLDTSFLQASTTAAARSEAHVMAQLQSPLFKQMGYAARVTASLVDQAPFAAIDRLANQLCAYSQELLTQWERSPWYHPVPQNPRPADSGQGSDARPGALNERIWEYFRTFAFAAVATLNAIAEKELLDDYRQRILPRDLFGLCSTMLSACASLNFIVLEFSREGFGAYRQLLRNIMAYIQRQPAELQPEIDGLTANLYHAMPWIRVTEERSHLGGDGLRHPRRCSILFYMDWMEQLVPHLMEYTLSRFVLPVARVYTGQWARHEAPDLFETAHAVLLAMLDGPHQGLALELAPWYSRLLLDLYPDCLNAEQLRIAYTAAVVACSATHSLRLAWGLVQQLLSILDPLLSNRSGESEYAPQPATGPGQCEDHPRVLQDMTAREMFLALADQIQSLPVSLLPQWCELIEERLGWTSSWGTRRAVLETIQDHILNRVSAEKKFEMAQWTWRLLAEYNRSAAVSSHRASGSGSCEGDKPKERSPLPIDSRGHGAKPRL
ncbi:hypothetical protein EV182_000967 [Spiromyces aspiralis]|uniref:Uncharacterized protein n=1 Tax=Spiromyces aspiralis TaxID=68401 RepID=A0ACC1HNT3_9FUNG|nr:hypothetical protein EV182_000967 [Spiromyces aspiralis]